MLAKGGLRLKSRLNGTVLARSIQVLPTGDVKKLILVVVLQLTLGVFDIFGVVIIGLMGALAVTGIQSLEPPESITLVLQTLHLDELTFQLQVASLAVLATAILTLRTVFSLIIIKRILFFLSRRSALITSNLVSKLLSKTLTEIRSRSTQETLYAVTAGVSAITLGIIGTTITIIADIAILFTMIVVLFLTDVLVAFTSVTFFGLLGLFLYKFMSVKAQTLGVSNSILSIEGNQKIIEVIASYRESLVRNRRQYYAAEILKARLRLADILAEIQVMPNVSKYVIESGMLIGALIIAGVQFAFQDAKSAVAVLSVFLAASTRIAPAIVRLQQNFIQIRGNAGAALPTLSLIDSLRETSELTEDLRLPDLNYNGFIPEVKLDSVSFKYEAAESLSLDQVSAVISPGSSVAIVGPSGSGKTTLMDVSMGILLPLHGKILISGLPPIDAIQRWPGSISYVPQDIMVTADTIRMNVGMGYPSNFVTDDLVWSALELSQFSDFVRNLPLGLSTRIGDGGLTLSGGQQQRLGIARAMFTKPKLLVLDEATSSLDGQNESDIAEALKTLKGSVTIVMIAHRLSSVRYVDKVAYVSKGRLVSFGTFEQVRMQVPDFDNQARLMGL